MNFRLDDGWLHDVLTQVVDRGGRRLRPARPRSRQEGHGRVRQRQPDGSPPRRPRPRRGLRRLGGPPPGADRPRRRAGVLRQRPRHPDPALRRLPGRPARPPADSPRAATRASTSTSGRREMPATPIRSSGAWPGPVRTSRRRLARIGHRLRHLVLASGRWSASGAIEQTLADLRERGVAYDHDGATWLRSTRLRRRQGPGPGQDRRRVHLPAARHRLPPGQVRPGLRAAHQRAGAPTTTATSRG